jgi:hypothetical protein
MASLQAETESLVTKIENLGRIEDEIRVQCFLDGFIMPSSKQDR